MDITFDTSFLVQIDRGNPQAIELIKKLTKEDTHLWISTITVSEIITGVYLRKDFEDAKQMANLVLGQFNWFNFNGVIAERTGEILAFLMSNKKPVCFQDAAIAATAIEAGAQYIITENKNDFLMIPSIREKVFNIKDMLEHIKKVDRFK
ncbi:MAG: type II toxin-antitoxin system VapC family toxin [Candidatus Micrarchaeota archaeon]